MSFDLCFPMQSIYLEKSEDFPMELVAGVRKAACDRLYSMIGYYEINLEFHEKLVSCEFLIPSNTLFRHARKFHTTEMSYFYDFEMISACQRKKMAFGDILKVCIALDLHFTV